MSSPAGETAPPRSVRFVRNVGASVIGQLGVMALSFFLTPRLIRALGIETYGLYVMLQAAASYLLLFSFGAGAATVKYCAEHAVAGGRAFREAVGCSAAVHLAGAAVGALLFSSAAPWCARALFHAPPPLLEPAVFTLRCAAAAAVFVALLQCSTSVLQGLQRFDWQNAATFLQNGLMIAGATALAAAGFGVKGVARWYALWSACVCLFAAAAAWRLGRRKWAGDGPALPRRDFLRYGLSMWAGSFAWIVTFQFDRLFIARASTLAAVTFYSVPANLLQRLQLFPAVVSSVLLPMFSEIQGEREAETVRLVYLRAVRSLLYLILPVLVLMFAFMPQFLGLWLGGDFSARSVWPARLLVVAQGALLLDSIPNAVAGGRGRPWYLSAVAWGQALVSVAAWALLIGRYGLFGVALGSLLAQALPAAAYLTVVHRRLLALSWGRFLADGLARPLSCAGLMLAAVFPFHESATTWPRLLTLGGAALTLYAAVSWAAMEDSDQDLLRRLARR